MPTTNKSTTKSAYTTKNSGPAHQDEKHEQGHIENSKNPASDYVYLFLMSNHSFESEGRLPTLILTMWDVDCHRR